MNIRLRRCLFVGLTCPWRTFPYSGSSQRKHYRRQISVPEHGGEALFYSKRLSALGFAARRYETYVPPPPRTRGEPVAFVLLAYGPAILLKGRGKRIYSRATCVTLFASLGESSCGIDRGGKGPKVFNFTAVNARRSSPLDRSLFIVFFFFVFRENYFLSNPRPAAVKRLARMKWKHKIRIFRSYS